MNVESVNLEGFGGVARLFPLPNLVLFPRMFQGLHIFEPRYRQMTADALRSDRYIALATLAPGWEQDYEGRPAIHPVACLGRVVADQLLPDGRYNLTLLGLSRVRIGKELELPGKLYRCAEVELMPDVDALTDLAEVDYRRRLLELIETWLAGQASALDVLRNLLKGHLSLGAASDVVSYALPLPMDFKQHLLETPEVEPRVKALIGHLESHGLLSGKRFPPDFSEN